VRAMASQRRSPGATLAAGLPPNAPRVVAARRKPSGDSRCCADDRAAGARGYVLSPLRG
jgi:hypothetical protein